MEFRFIKEIIAEREDISRQLIAADIKKYALFHKEEPDNLDRLQEYMKANYHLDGLKVALVDKDNQPVAWPFATAQFENFDPARETFRADNKVYSVSSRDLEYSGLKLYYFFAESNLNIYRIISIMLLLFLLYFFVYQFIVELLKIDNAESYFENIDFTIFNNLQEGIIIANKFDKIVFANSVTYDFFAEKKIVFKKTRLQDVLGKLVLADERVTLKKWDNLLEIVSSPLFKNGKPLGSLVVISLSTEREKLCKRALGKIVELHQDGILFVDKDNKIIASNMMSRYYLGELQNDKDLNEVNPELAGLVEDNIGNNSISRGKLTYLDFIYELVSVYGEGGAYAGTVIFLRDEAVKKT